MIVSVISDLVAFVNNATNKPRVPLRIYTHEEKRGLHIGGFQNIQDLWRPSRVRAVVKSDCDLMLAARAPVIKSRELRGRAVFPCQITVGVHSNLSRAISTIFIDSYDLAVANIRCGVGRFSQSKCLSRLFIQFEI